MPELFVVNPGSARVTVVVVCVSVCLSVCPSAPELPSQAMNHSTNNATCSASGIRRVFSETAAFGSYTENQVNEAICKLVLAYLEMHAL